MPRVAVRPLLLLLGLALLGCGGGDKGPVLPPAQQGFAVVLSTTALTLEQGAVGTITVNVTRTGSFAGVVTLSPQGLRPGVAGVLSPSALSAGAAPHTLTLTVADTVPAGTYTFAVRGQATGIADHEAAVTLTVTAKPKIAMTVSPTSGSVAAGASTAFAATVVRTNFTGAVALGVSGAPTGVSTTVSTTGDVHTATLNVATTVAPGTYTLTASASAAGVTTVTAPFTLTVTAPVTASIGLSAAPAAFTVAPNGTPVGTVIAINRNSFNGPVTLAVQSGLPAGLTAAFSPAAATTGNSVIANFTAAATVPNGTYNVVVQGTATGATTGTVQLVVTVSGTPPSSIALTAAPSTVTTAQGTSVGTIINITRTNIVGPVTLTSTNVPTGITATFGAPVSTQNSSSLNLAVAANVPIGTYTINVTGAATGVSNVTIPVTLNVTQGQVGGGNVTFRFCGAPSSIPVWLAYQNAFGQWQRATTVAPNTWSFTINTIGGVAWVTQSGADAFEMNIAYGTFADLNVRGAATCVSPTTKTVTGTVTGFTGATDLATITLGGARAATTPNQASPGFTISGVPAGTVDLAATRTTISLGPPPSSAINRLYLRRGLTPTDQGSVGTVDFGGSESFAPETKQLTMVGVTIGEQVTALSTFTSANGGILSLGSSLGSSALNYLAVPAARTAVGDLHSIYAFAPIVSGGDTVASRGLVTWTRDPAANRTLTLGSQLNSPTITSVASAPYARVRAVLTRQGEYDNSWSATFIQPARSAVITLSSGYMANNGAFDVTIPDFTAVTGWQNTWGLLGGTTTDWNVTALGWVVGGGSTAEGSITRVGVRSGTITL